MRNITIVGGGPAGLMLAIGLRRAGYDVCLTQDRSASSITHGRVMSSQCVFSSARAEERKLGLDLWSKQTPAIEGFHIRNITPPGSSVPPIAFTGLLQAPAESVDQRLKVPAWMGIFEELGGTIEIMQVEVADLERFARDSDLVIVAAGKGALSALFPLDKARSPFGAPRRSLAMVYLRGVAPQDGPLCVSSIAFPNAGSIIFVPALTHGGACEILFFEALIGGPLDACHVAMSTGEQWAVMKALVERLMPWESDRFKRAEVTDSGASFAGHITPTVRHGIAYLPSGHPVLGLGDAVVLNDPLVGQGANNAIRMAALYLDGILSRRDQPFDEAWMRDLFANGLRRVEAATLWTNMALLPPPPHVVKLFMRAAADQAVANRFVHGFDEPDTILPLLLGRAAP
jgi:Styrene monooxygenase A putative substrate binding domain/FAD binding domain